MAEPAPAAAPGMLTFDKVRAKVVYEEMDTKDNFDANMKIDMENSAIWEKGSSKFHFIGGIKKE